MQAVVATEHAVAHTDYVLLYGVVEVDDVVVVADDVVYDNHTDSVVDDTQRHYHQYQHLH